MEKQFTFPIEKNDYADTPKVEKSFDNSYGKWDVVVIRKDNSLGGYVVLHTKTKSKIPERLLEKVNITLNIINGHASSNYQVYDFPAIFIPKTSCFAFCFPTKAFIEGYPRYTIDIKINAWLPQLMSELEEISPNLSLIGYLENMHEEGKLADVTIKTKKNEEWEMKVHNFILSRSKVFFAMLNSHDTKEAQTKVIQIEDIAHDVLVEMVRYLYTDKVPEIEEMALDLLIAANKYDIPGLVSECENYLADNLSIESFAEILIVADRLKIHKLKEVVMKFIVDNLKTVFATESWKCIKEKNISLAMEVIETSI